MKKGFVYLVGAGPGRPELLTIRGAECLALADVVVMDALVSRRLLEHCAPGVQVLEAGKRGRGRVLMRQPEINRNLARLARAGKTVVRLKGGDPYFFGRGGEEAEFLAGQNIAFETVPGVSSVNGATAYAGVPVTHRGYTSTVTVVTGHAGVENPYLRETREEFKNRTSPGVAWEKLSPDNTLVILMGLGQLPSILAKLRAAGWPAETPALACQWGTFPFQKSVEGTLADLPARIKESNLGAPAVIVTGSVVTLRSRLNWFEKLPLFGRTVLVTRAAAQSSTLVKKLETWGACALEGPVIRVEPLPLSGAGRTRLRKIASYNGAVFTSANAARIFTGHWAGMKKPWPPGCRVLAIGPKTAEALVRGGLPVHFVAPEFVSESLAASLGKVSGQRFLFPRAEEGRDVLVEALKKAGAGLDLWPLYRTRPVGLEPEVKDALLAGRCDCVVFTSSSTVHFFMGQLSRAQAKEVFARAAAASIGPVTTAALKRHGVKSIVQARRSTAEDLAEAIRKKLARKE